MSDPSSDSDVDVHFSPFYEILHSSLDRLLEFVNRDSFTFFVNGESIDSTIAEAISISPSIFELLRSNPLNFSFSITSKSYDSSDFRSFLDFARCRASARIPRGRALSFISICGSLGNESLSLALLSSLHRKSAGALRFTSSGESGRDSVSGNSAVAAGTRKAICESTIDECASQFYSYSAEDLGFLDCETLHRLLSSEFLSIESEDWLLRLLLDLGVDRFDFLGHIEPSFLSSSGLSLFLDEVQFDDVSEAIWSQVISRLKGISPSGNSRRHVKLLDSLILREIPSELQKLVGQSWELLYRGSRDGFAASNFHCKCDGRSNTVSVIETTKGFIFGGFTPTAWDSSNSSKGDSSQKSFLFTVKNPRGTEFRKFSLKNPSKAIRCSVSYGPLFEGYCDLGVHDNCNADANSWTNLGEGYTNDTGIDGTRVFTGEQNFTVKEIEVFTIPS
jgi:hypothetical protein